ncbi:MAG: preprotein translocase subunit YajC [Sphingobacteriales bacterium]|jgi:preprotein translocase subunit YajC|nr:preprotein translocase subunit YajC [Sphingobacteriales bacterium]MBP9142285.1 preprotein translocase subunit YajC [Chitinophagales bacterium]MDA0198569.1 preprotein translocase subunit YajC [Bacteroidota bacterium]MBK6889234.1 preprotein translocase subunit YajC [Sphingobacteriales bacterium]MBK7528260.1 preprotein translocase subunit YajC [Sphingobacteriales bacterium]
MNQILFLWQGIPSEYGTILLMLGMFAIMYFLIIRPQVKRAKEQQNYIGQLQKGDKIVTTGGIYGKILKVNNRTFLIEVDTGTKLKIEKSSVSSEWSKSASTEADETQA